MIEYQYDMDCEKVLKLINYKIKLKFIKMIK